MPSLLTAEELLYLTEPDKQTELLRGTLIVREPPGYQHGVVALKVARLIANHVHDHGLGTVVAAETGFKLFSNPDTVRAPDAAFIRQGRAPEPALDGYPALAPDLVVEVVSPSDRAGEVQAKVSDWLTAGSRLVWVIDPASQTGSHLSRRRVRRSARESGCARWRGRAAGILLLPRGPLVSTW